MKTKELYFLGIKEPFKGDVILLINSKPSWLKEETCIIKIIKVVSSETDKFMNDNPSSKGMGVLKEVHIVKSFEQITEKEALAELL